MALYGHTPTQKGPKTPPRGGSAVVRVTVDSDIFGEIDLGVPRISRWHMRRYEAHRKAGEAYCWAAEHPVDDSDAERAATLVLYERALGAFNQALFHYQVAQMLVLPRAAA